MERRDSVPKAPRNDAGAKLANDYLRELLASSQVTTPSKPPLVVREAFEPGDFRGEALHSPAQKYSEAEQHDEA